MRSLLTLALLSGVTAAGGTQDALPNVAATTRGRDFSFLYSQVVAGELDYIAPAALIAEILETDGGLTTVECDALLEAILIHADEQDLGLAAGVLLSRFNRLSSWSLRARVLSLGYADANPLMHDAVLQSAVRLAEALSGYRPDVLAGYEVEAVTLAGIAPRYGSVPLAEVLREIAVHSRDARVVSGARRAAGLILDGR